VVNLQVGWLVGGVHTKPLRHATESAAEATLAVALCRCRVILMMALLTLAGDNAAEAILVVA
jgi:hypothetical protein